MDNMNFNQNDNFYGPLFGNNNVDSSFVKENEIAQESQNDLPPELGEIKNLNDATVMQAPTMDALGPANFVTENQTLVNDPLDLYERNGFIKNESEFPLPSFEQNNMNTINQTFNNDFSNSSFKENNTFSNIDNTILNNFSGLGSENDINSDYNISSNFNSFSPTNSENKFNIPVNNEAENHDYEIVNRPLEQSTNNYDFSNTFYNENNVIQNNFSGLNSENEINNDIETNDFEILNKSLVQDSNEENKLLDKETDDIELSKPEDIINSKEEENITDISSLGIDEIYTEPDSLEIFDTELFDEEDEINIIDKTIVSDISENSNEDIESIKKIVEELKAKGKNIKVEEFDFENMHQLIIIMEK